LNLYQTEGIVFKAIKYGETSLICDIYTRERGLKSFIVSGVRSVKSSQKAVIYRPLNIVNIIAYEKDNDKLARIKEINLSVHYGKLNLDVLTSSVGIFLIEICRDAIKEREANAPMYDFLEERFLFLDSADQFDPLFHINFLLNFSTHLGFGPSSNFDAERFPYFDLEDGTFTPIGMGKYSLNLELSEILNDLINQDISKNTSKKFPLSVRNRLLDALLIYYRLHISELKELNSLSVLRQVLT